MQCVCVCVFITSAGQKLLTACRDFREPEMKDLFEICMTRYASVCLCVEEELCEYASSGQIGWDQAADT